MVFLSVLCAVYGIEESIMLEEDKEDECEVYVPENCFFCVTWRFIVVVRTLYTLLTAPLTP